MHPLPNSLYARTFSAYCIPFCDLEGDLQQKIIDKFLVEDHFLYIYKDKNEYKTQAFNNFHSASRVLAKLSLPVFKAPLSQQYLTYTGRRRFKNYYVNRLAPILNL